MPTALIRRSSSCADFNRKSQPSLNDYWGKHHALITSVDKPSRASSGTTLTLPYPTLPYPTLPYPTLPHPTPPHPTPPHPTPPHPTPPHPTPTLPYPTPPLPLHHPYPSPTIPYPTLPTLPYPTLPYPTLPLPYPTPTLPYPINMASLPFKMTFIIYGFVQFEQQVLLGYFYL